MSKKSHYCEGFWVLFISSINLLLKASFIFSAKVAKVIEQLTSKS